MKKRSITPYLFIAPHLVLFLLFFVVPTFFGLFASFTKWNLFNDPTWVGLANYKTILFDSSSTFHFKFWNGLKNTFLFVLMCAPLQVLLPLTMALALYSRPRGRGFFQAAFYLPNLFSITAVVLTWVFIFNRSMGLWNRMFGTDINWYGEQPYAWLTILMPTLWWVIGTNLIIYIAAFSGIDKEIMEACDIDGVMGWKRFVYIIVPLIKHPLLYTVITSIVSQFNIYGQPLLLTKGGPNGSTYVLLMYIRELAFGTGNPIAGMSSAMAICLGVIIGVVSVAQLIVLRKQDEA